MEFAEGYLRIGTWNAIPVRVHWTAPIGIFVFSGLHLAPAVWFGVALVIFIHEVGHAVVVRRCAATPTSIDFTGIGGECHWYGVVGRFERCLIAWGGVAAQTVLLAATCAVTSLLKGPQSTVAHDLVSAFLMSNALMVIVNLLPFRPLDGREAWRIVPIGLWELMRVLRRAYERVSARVTLRRLERLEGSDKVPALPPDIREQLERVCEVGRGSVDDDRA
jgi:Zn-dependent protease